jgi:hypothetical protein
MPSNVPGLSPQLFDEMLKRPYDSLPRFDAGVHIRAQTQSLENKVKKNYTQIALDMKHYMIVFEHFETALSRYFFVETPLRFNITESTETATWPRIFISCDDVEVRSAFVAYLMNRTSDIGQFTPIFVNTTDIKHMKHIDYGNTTIASQGIVDTAFDWYALSLCNVCFAWRGKYSSVVSTFMQSASRVSMRKLSSHDFKSKVLHRDGKWYSPYDYIDNIHELETELKIQKAKKKKG